MFFHRPFTCWFSHIFQFGCHKDVLVTVDDSQAVAPEDPNTNLQPFPFSFEAITRFHKPLEESATGVGPDRSIPEVVEIGDTYLEPEYPEESAGALTSSAALSAEPCSPPPKPTQEI